MHSCLFMFTELCFNPHMRKGIFSIPIRSFYHAYVCMHVCVHYSVLSHAIARIHCLLSEKSIAPLSIQSDQKTHQSHYVFPRNTAALSVERKAETHGRLILPRAIHTLTHWAYTCKHVVGKILEGQFYRL